VGLCGSVLSLIKVIGNIAKRAFKEGYYYGINKPSEKLNAEKTKFRIDNNNARKNHLTNLALNICRMIPVVGTLTSISRLYVGPLANVLTSR
jgi:hypothetical protein